MHECEKDSFDMMDGARVVQQLIDHGPFGKVAVVAGTAYPKDHQGIIDAPIELVNDKKFIHVKLTVTKPQGKKKTWALSDLKSINKAVNDLVIAAGKDPENIQIEMQAVHY